MKKYKSIFLLPVNILSIDFDNNKRYFYKSAPKYLDINKIYEKPNKKFIHHNFLYIKNKILKE